MKLLVIQLSPPSSHAIPLCYKYSPQHPVLTNTEQQSISKNAIHLWQMQYKTYGMNTTPQRNKREMLEKEESRIIRKRERAEFIEVSERVIRQLSTDVSTIRLPETKREVTLRL
jgi:hypothetical protein